MHCWVITQQAGLQSLPTGGMPCIVGGLEGACFSAMGQAEHSHSRWQDAQR